MNGERKVKCIDECDLVAHLGSEKRVEWKCELSGLLILVDCISWCKMKRIVRVTIAGSIIT